MQVGDEVLVDEVDCRVIDGNLVALPVWLKERVSCLAAGGCGSACAFSIGARVSRVIMRGVSSMLL